MKTKECPNCAMDVDSKSKTCPICQHEFQSLSRGMQIVTVILIALLLMWAIL